MLVILGAVVLLMSFLAFRHLTNRGAHGISLSFLALICLVLGFFIWRTWRLETELTQAVQTLTADSEISVNCQGFLREFRLDNNLGEVAFDGKGGLSKTAELRSSVCGELRGWLGSEKSAPSRDQVVAVHVLSHEAVHASGVASEAHTECLAMQYDAQLAMLLGATAEHAEALATRYWYEVFPRMPNEYRAVDCYPNGPLDLTPDDDRWPAGVVEYGVASGL